MTGRDTPHPPRKPIFDTVRDIMQRSFRQSEVERLDHAIDRTIEGAIDGAIDGAIERALGVCPDAASSAAFSAQDRVTGGPSVPRIRRNEGVKSRSQRRVGPEGIALIKRFEGCARLRPDGLVEAYPDPGTGDEPWTIGWGATGAGLKPGSRIGPGTVWTQAQCDARLETDLERFAADVANAIGDAPTSAAQFDALVSFHYNTGAIRRATLTRRHCEGDHHGTAREFARWNKAGGRILKGLVRRRAAEAALYLS